MTKLKENDFSFEDDGKESFKTRLKKLIGQRSIRAAAREWGLSFSTLNNYLNKGTEPSFTAIRGIASHEKVSLDWLAYGSQASEYNNKMNRMSQEVNSPMVSDKLAGAWLMVLESAEPEEAVRLIKLINRKGIERLLSDAPALNEQPMTHQINSLELSELEQALIQLPEDEKTRLMALHEAKKGASEGGEVTTGSSANVKRKQAV